MTILFFEEFQDSSTLQWVAIRAEDLKNFPSGKESLVVCFKNSGQVYEYTEMDTKGDYSPRNVFSTMRGLKKTSVRPGSFFNSVKDILREYKIHGRFASFSEFHLRLYGENWKPGSDISSSNLFVLPKLGLGHCLIDW